MEATIKNLLLTALAPIGKTLYIYGGGWNEADSAAGTEARTLGLSPRWKKFYFEHTKNYNFKDFNYKKDPSLIHKGLDCSAYIGWVLYNIFETENNGEGYVYKSTKIAEVLANKGLGTFTPAKSITHFRPADILSGAKTAHTFIALSQCPDGSLLLLHSSPPAPMISATPTPTGDPSVAESLAKAFMQTAFPAHYDLHPQIGRPVSYLTDYNLFRFYPHILKDPDNYAQKSPFQILADLIKSLS